MLELIILILATWRVSSIIASESGPYNIFEIIRDYSARKHHMLYEMLSCVWCNSVWIGLFFTSMYLTYQSTSYIIILPFTLSGGAIIVEGLVSKLTKDMDTNAE